MREIHVYDLIVVGGGPGGYLRRPGRAGYPGAGKTLRWRTDGPDRGN